MFQLLLFKYSRCKVVNEAQQMLSKYNYPTYLYLKKLSGREASLGSASTKSLSARTPLQKFGVDARTSAVVNL